MAPEGQLSWHNVRTLKAGANPASPTKKKNNPLPDQKKKRKDLRAFFFYNQEKICDLHNVGRGPFIFGPRQRAKADKEQDNFKYGPKGPT